MQELSRSIEDYLKAIYELEVRGETPAQTSAIAERLSVAPPSVSGMIKRLSQSGLVEHVRYHGVILTDEGRREALKMVRRHRILETYLTEQLGYTWDEVHEEAERLEHAVSDLLTERMSAALGDPSNDPHGAPIPGPGGDYERPEVVPLSELAVGSSSVFNMVGDRDPERLRFIESLGLKPGVRFKVLEKQPFKGPVTIELEGSDKQIIGHELAAALLCSTS